MDAAGQQAEVAGAQTPTAGQRQPLQCRRQAAEGAALLGVTARLQTDEPRQAGQQGGHVLVGVLGRHAHRLQVRVPLAQLRRRCLRESDDAQVELQNMGTVLI